MKHSYSIKGMTCQGCVASVKGKLEGIPNVQEVEVNLEKGEATISIQEHIPIGELRASLPEKYSIAEKESGMLHEATLEETSKWKQLRPLFLIFAYLFAAAFLLNYKAWDSREAMLDFMGLFYIVFSFFKFLDLRGFPDSFRMYDPLAKAVPVYGWVYPFLELGLGLFFLMRFQVQLALWATVFILGVTTFGVTKTLLDKKSIRCACLGTALKLPMTEATFIENAIMLVMAFWMILA
ncbi:heavy-metal-associated domain-containing protein [Flagellimonas allohymeniacidonis]|uniref:Heavy metal transporter n=1 Tax=Flagellimonas allohymeniacidonis TaxID=2517819 RepID=A0A4Q8QCJ5_9FLAO|nr:heavy metal-associated domain-containing protein [Allomuricauda hymeniacidonis]TAI48061.1 heavy metal transporter [Allomuricauda hymeniacidonis]